MRHLHKVLLAIPALLLVASIKPLPTQAADFRAGDTTTVNDTISQDLFNAGSHFTLNAPLSGELFAAGNEITLNQTPGRSSFLAGSNIEINNGIGYNLFAAGSTIKVNGSVGNEAYIFGSNVTLTKDSVVHGDLRITGNDITLDGTITGTVHVRANTLKSSGTIGGSLVGSINSLEFTGGTIGGALDYKSDADASGLDKVAITGATHREPLPNQGYTLLITTLWTLASALLLGAFLIWRFPKRLQALQDTFVERYGSSLGWAALTLFLAPLGLIILFTSTVGIKIGFVLSGLFFAFLVLTGVLGLFIIGKYVLTQILPQQSQNLWSQLVAGALIAYLIRMVPVVGPIVGFLLFIFVFLPTFGVLLRTTFAKR